MGFEIAKELSCRGMHVILLGRSVGVPSEFEICIPVSQYVEHAFINMIKTFVWRCFCFADRTTRVVLTETARAAAERIQADCCARSGWHCLRTHSAKADDDHIHGPARKPDRSVLSHTGHGAAQNDSAALVGGVEIAGCDLASLADVRR